MRKFTKSGMTKKILVLLVLVFTACETITEQAGRLLDGSASKEKTLGVFLSIPAEAEEMPQGIEARLVRDQKGKEYFLIIPAAFPWITLRTTVPGKDGRFYPASLHYLGGSYEGWNEFTLELSGAGRALLQESILNLRFTGALEPGQISWGKIRHKDRRISGDEALTSLRNRHERILALCGWMREREGPPAFKGQKNFEAYWKPLLMPEMCRREEQALEYRAEGALWTRGEDVLWNTRYTEFIFPEHLRPLRNSGALLRDWEEAGEWIYLIYHWDFLSGLLSGDRVLIKEVQN